MKIKRVGRVKLLEFQIDWDNIYNKNLKINKDGTVSPKDPKKPSSLTTKPAPK